MREPALPWPEVARIADDVRDGRTDPAAPARRALRRIDKDDRSLGAFTRTRMPAVGDRGRLAGVPFAVKDNIDLAGETTTAGTVVSGRPPAAADATVVQRMRHEGAVVVGTTNMSEFACSAVTENQHYGITRNPWHLDRSPGGSSGGAAAAVSAGMVPVALGTDTGGSVLIPAALTGICGIRPTAGRISVEGVVPLSPTLDTVGVLARRVDDLQEVMSVLDVANETSSPLGSFPPVVRHDASTERPLTGTRIGVLTGWFREGCDDAVLAAVDAAVAELAALGATTTTVALPSAAAVTAAAKTIVWAEAAVAYREFTTTPPRHSSVLHRLTDGASTPVGDFIEALRVRTRWSREMAAAFADVDVLVSATTPIPAPPVGSDQETVTRTLVRLTYPGCQAGTPAVSIPCGLVDGLPIGLQLIAAWGAEGRLLDVAGTYTAAKYAGVAPIPGSGTG
jgi:aspartyl-tRNA(Asn)/glutamyl-tRNA(Gln) amidotransferase subunit A